MRESPSAGGDGDAGLTKRERRLLGSIAEYLGFADLLALLMVSATAFTGYATWRTATIANALFLSSERPYIGVKSVELDNRHPGDPRVEIEYENYGHVSAENTRMVRQLRIDARAVAGQTKAKDAGILSPEVPHHMHLHVPLGSYDAIVAGRSQLEVEVAATYRGPGREPMCYLERFTYTPDEKQFEVDGGTTRCADLKELDAASSGSDGDGPRSD